MNNQSKSIVLSEIQAKVVRLIKYENTNTRSALAKVLSLSKAAITPIVAEMLMMGVLSEVGEAVNLQAKGRNAMMLELNCGYRLAIGVCIDKYAMQFIIATLDGQVVEKSRISIVELSYHDVLSVIVSELKRVVDGNCIANERIFGVGVCVSDGVFDLIEGVDKLNRIKKDLSHALSYKIYSASVGQGLLMAHKLFATDPAKTGCVAVVRIDDEISFDYMVDCVVNRATNKRVGLLADIDFDEDEECLDKLSEAINIFDRVLSPARLLILCKDTSLIEQVNLLLEGKYKQKLRVEPCFVSLDRIALAGCAVVFDKFFNWL